MDLNHLATEKRNEETMNLDLLTPLEFVKVMNAQDQKVAEAIELKATEISRLIAEATDRFRQGGRLIYMGAGTSGRLGVLDAAECVPTFGTDKSQVIGIIAGGKQAMTEAVEGAEDNEQLAVEDLQALSIAEKDIVIGIAASGRTPYVLSGLSFANEAGALTGSISCNPNSKIGNVAQHAIDVEVGPEILTGSTRLKSGTAQKLILNMISTGVMVGIGKVYENLMIDVKPTNAKLKQRAINMVADLTELDIEKSEALLMDSDWSVKTAIVMGVKDINKDEAESLLDKHQGFIRPLMEG